MLYWLNPATSDGFEAEICGIERFKAHVPFEEALAESEEQLIWILAMAMGGMVFLILVAVASHTADQWMKHKRQMVRLQANQRVRAASSEPTATGSQTKDYMIRYGIRTLWATAGAVVTLVVQEILRRY